MERHVVVTLMSCVVAALALAAAPAGSAQSAPQRPRITGIDHVAYRVSDMAAAKRFYGEVVGLSERTARDGRAVFAIGPHQAVHLEPGLPAAEDERLSHVAFGTPDVRALAAYLAARGVAVPKPSAGCSDAAIRVADPDGHPIEFVPIVWPDRRASGGSDYALSQRLLHTGLIVRDEHAAHAFYRDVLGFSEFWRGGRPEGVTNWVNMRLPDGTDYLEYMLHASAPDRRQRGSAHHICLRVTDIETAWTTAAARSQAIGRPVPSPPNVGVNGKWQLNLFDPDGTRVELMEPYRTR